MKMSKIYIVFIYCLPFFVLGSCDTDKNIESPDKNFFMKLYGGDGDQEGVDMIALDDGSFLLLGNSTWDDVTKIYLVKASSEGKVIWQRKFGVNDGITIAKDIEPINNGFVILGTAETPSNGKDVKLIRISSEGAPIDSVMYGWGKDDDANSVTPLLDGGFIVTGATTYDTTRQDPNKPIDPDAYMNVFHYRCNASLVFDKNWYEFYGAVDKFDVGTKVIQESNSRFYVFAYSNQEFGNHNGAYKGKLNLAYYSLSGSGIVSNNVAVLGKDFNLDTRSSYVCELPAAMGGGILLIGTTNTSGGSALHVSTLRTPLRFNAQDDRGIDDDLLIGNTVLEAVSAAASLNAPTGYLLLANESRTIGTNIWLTKIDQSARIQWSVSLGSEGEDDKAAAVKELPDGKIIVLGTVGIADNQTKMGLFKLNSSGRLQD